MMIFRTLLAMVVTLLVVADSQAGPFQRRRQQTVQQSTFQQITTVTPNSFSQTTFSQTTTTTGGVTPMDALDEVNAKRATRGLRPFLRDDGLTMAAHRCAEFRAANLLFGHTSNDFSFLSGASASAAGCAAYPESYGWMSCCTWESYTYAGAAWVMGRDGKRYMHLFVR